MRYDSNSVVQATLVQMEFYTLEDPFYEKLRSLRAFIYICRIKRDIEQILKELLLTKDTKDETTPDIDGNKC